MIIFITATGNKAVLIVLFVLALIYIAWNLGKEDGKWGMMIALIVIFLIGLIVSAFK